MCAAVVPSPRNEAEAGETGSTVELKENNQVVAKVGPHLWLFFHCAEINFRSMPDAAAVLAHVWLLSRLACLSLSPFLDPFLSRPIAFASVSLSPHPSHTR